MKIFSRKLYEALCLLYPLTRRGNRHLVSIRARVGTAIIGSYEVRLPFTARTIYVYDVDIRPSLRRA